MNTFHSRLKFLRKKKRLSQGKLAKKIEVSYSQYGRYELGISNPSAEALQKIADYFDVSIDYLIYGDSDQKAINTLNDNEVLKHFKEIEKLPVEEKNTVLKFIGAYLRDFKARQTYA